MRSVFIYSSRIASENFLNEDKYRLSDSHGSMELNAPEAELISTSEFEIRFDGCVNDLLLFDCFLWGQIVPFLRS